MGLPEGLSGRIEARIAEFLADPKPNDARAAVAALGVLPLVLDWSGGWGLHPDGRVISFLYEWPHEARVEPEERLCNLALFQGSRRYPELRPLAPGRPPGARDCPDCGGTGIAPVVARLGRENIVCGCGGLGWLPPGARGGDRRIRLARAAALTLGLAVLGWQGVNVARGRFLHRFLIADVALGFGLVIAAGRPEPRAAAAAMLAGFAALGGVFLAATTGRLLLGGDDLGTALTSLGLVPCGLGVVILGRWLARPPG